MHTPTSPRSPSSRRSGAFATIAGLLLLALSASACTVGAGEVSIGPEDAVSSDSATAAEPANDVGTETANAAEPDDDGSYGPEPQLQTFRLSADVIRWTGELLGVDYTYTEIDDRDQDVRYIAIGDDNGVRASYFSEGANLMQVCVETADGCGGGDPSGIANVFAPPAVLLFAEWAPYTFDSGPRIAGGILLGETVGWEVIDPNFTFDGRSGRCYRSLGFYQWQGDPEPTETAFPAGDIACVLFYEFGSEYLVSYDFGGDGTVEIETLRLADGYTEADFVHPSYMPAQFDQAALERIIEGVDAASASGDEYAILAG